MQLHVCSELYLTMSTNDSEASDSCLYLPGARLTTYNQRVWPSG